MTTMTDTVLCGEALESLKALPDACIDLVVTSPPYNIGKEYERKRALADYLEEQSRILGECYRVLRSTGSLLWQVGAFTEDGTHVPLDVKVFPILEGLGMIPRNRIVWIRPHGVHARNRFSCRHETLLWFTKSDDYQFNLEPIRVPQKYQNKTYWKGEKHGQLSCDPVGKNPGDVWAFRNVKHNHEEQTIHPCQFPEDMIERVILATTDVGDVVLDPYVGSGTTALVSKRLGRRYVGFDTNEAYVAVALARLAGEPDPSGNFPNLRALREYAERKGVSDVSRFRFTRQVGKVATTRDKAKIFPEQLHLSKIIEELEDQASESAYQRAARVQERE